MRGAFLEDSTMTRGGRYDFAVMVSDEKDMTMIRKLAEPLEADRFCRVRPGRHGESVKLPFGCLSHRYIDLELVADGFIRGIALGALRQEGSNL